MPQKFNYKQWLLIGLLLRLAVMPFTLHGDVLFINRLPHLFLHGEWDAYGVSFREFDSGYYPPLILLFLALFQWVAAFFSSGFESFLHALSDHSVKDLLDSSALFQSVFLMKAPYLFFDGLILWAGAQIIKSESAWKYFLASWALNPLVIYSSYMLGQFDLTASAMVVLSFYLILKKGKEHWACLFASFGVLLKLYPLVLFPVLVLIGARNIKDGIRLSCYAIGPVVFLYGVFFAISGKPVFWILSVFSSNLDPGFTPEKLILRICQAAVYFFVCLHIFISPKDQLNYEKLNRYFLLVFFAVFWGMPINQTHYFIWMIPFLTFISACNKAWRKPALGLILLIFLNGFRARSSAFGIFAPLNPEFFLSLPSLQDATGFLFDQSWYDWGMGWIYKLATFGMVAVLIKGLWEELPRPLRKKS